MFSDADCELHNIPTTTPFVERAELLRHSRWVDDVLADARYQVTLEFCKQHRIDFVAVLEGTSVDPSCDKERLKGYDDLKAHGMYLSQILVAASYSPFREGYSYQADDRSVTAPGPESKDSTIFRGAHTHSDRTG